MTTANLSSVCLLNYMQVLNNSICVTPPLFHHMVTGCYYLGMHMPVPALHGHEIIGFLSA